MTGKIQNFAWGILFNIFFVTMCAICTNIFRSTAPLSTPIAFIFLYFGEALSTVPLIPIAIKNWTVTTPRRWTIFILFGFVLNANFLIWRAASSLMPLGPYAAIAGSGILFSPALAATLHRRCVSVVDMFGIVAAMVGLLLVTHPAFLFERPVDVPVHAYCFAVFNAIVSSIFPFFFGATADEHWSNFLVLRLICGAVVAGVCFGVADGSLATAPTLASVGVAVVGVASTVYRLSQQVGCYELEAFDVGLAGFLGNVLMAGVIPMTALLSAAFFGESLFVIEVVGIGVVFSAIVVVTAVKGYTAKRQDINNIVK